MISARRNMALETKTERDQLRNKILALKEAKKAVILAHNYQRPEVQDLGDFVGDSLELAKISQKLSSNLIVFCGVKFMAETAKILSPRKKVIIPVREAGCPLAETIEPFKLIALKEENPDARVVSYVNTTAQIKALSDLCCTSANAVSVVKKLPDKKIIFIPDKNLGWWVKKNLPEKEIVTWGGYCYVHEQFTLEDYRAARVSRPAAEMLVHPECRPEILENADFVLSTSGILKHAKKSSAKEFIIGTEEGLIYRLKKENPDKKFYSLGAARMCLNMKKTTLKEVHQSLDKEVYAVELEGEIIRKAKVALERMVSHV